MTWFCVQIKRLNKTVKTCISKENRYILLPKLDMDWAEVLTFHEKEKKQTTKQTEVFPQNGTRRWGREKERKKSPSLNDN